METPPAPKRARDDPADEIGQANQAVDSKEDAEKSSDVAGSTHGIGHLSLLEMIPPELSHKLLEYVPEKIAAIKVASSVMNRRAKSFVNHSSHLKCVSALRFYGPASDGLPLQEIEFEICKRHVDLVQLRLKPILEGLSLNIKCRWGDTLTYEIQLRKNPDHSAIRKFLECMGPNLERLDLVNCIDAQSFVFIANLLGDSFYSKCIAINTHTLTDHIVPFLRKAVEVHNVDEVLIELRFQLLTHLSDHVKSIRIIQRKNERFDAQSNYFFGLRNQDWAAIIGDMYSRKLDKLWLENIHHIEYLTLEGTDKLTTTLPYIGKKVWFEASCRHYANPKKVVNRKNEKMFDIIRDG